MVAVDCGLLIPCHATDAFLSVQLLRHSGSLAQMKRLFWMEIQ